MKYLLVLLLALNLCAAALAQPAATLPFLSYLREGVDNRPEVRAAAAQLKWFDSHRYGASYVDEMDVRLGKITDDKNEYAIRIRPTNPFFYAAGRNLAATLRAQARLSYLEAKEKAVFKAFESWIKIWYRSQTLNLISESLDWRERWSAEMRSQVQSENFDPEEVLDLEIDQIDLAVSKQAEQSKLDAELSQFFEFVSVADSASVSPTADPLNVSLRFPVLSPEAVIRVADSLYQDNDTAPLELEMMKLAVEQARQKMVLEKMDWDVGFVQPEWETQSNDQFSLRVGIGVPLFRGNRMQIQNRQLDVLEENRQLAEAEFRWSSEVDQSYLDLSSIAARLSALDSLQTNLLRIRGGLSTLESSDSREILLKWLKASEKLKKKKLEDQYLLLLAYLEYLSLKGALLSSSATGFLETVWK